MNARKYTAPTLEPVLATAYDALRAFPAQSKTGSAGLADLVLLVTGNCNLKCTYCFANQGEYTGQPSRAMTRETAIAAVDKALERFGSVGCVKFFGGEPSTNPQALEAVCGHFTKLHSRGRFEAMPRFATVTNLVSMSDVFVDIVGRYGVQVTVSLDGPREIHDRLRPRMSGRGSFDATVANVRRLQEATGQPDGAECVYTPLHYQLGLHPVEVSRFLRSLGIPQVLIHPLVESDGYLSKFADEQAEAYLGDLRELQRQNMRAEVELLIADRSSSPAIVRGVLDLIRSNSKWHCGMGQTTFTIDVNGSTWPCYMCIGMEEYRLGDVDSTDIGPDFNGFKRQRTLYTKAVHPICRECDLVEACHGCLGKMMQHAPQGRPFDPIRPTCEWLAGTIEGLLEGILQARRCPSNWTMLLCRLGLEPTGS